MGEANNDSKHLSNVISGLPDEVLQTILDKLPVVDAVNTGFLSRRWRDLWKYISIVEFDPSWVELTRKEIVPSVNQFICLHRGQKIQIFSVKFTYKPEMSPSVDSWILFAINKNVEDLELDFDVGDNNIIQNTAYAPSYKLPPSIFNSKSIVRLVLCFCSLELPIAFRLQALTMVRLHRIELPDDAIQMLTSNAPALQQLYLSDCNRTKDLRIYVAPNPNFCNLVIFENFFPVNHSTKIYIKVPTLYQVAFMGSMPRSRYITEEPLECAEAHFSLQGMFTACGKYGLNILVSNSRALKYEYVLLELLLRHHRADTFRMCNWCIQLLSLHELRNLRRFTFNCTTLEISSTFQKWELPGIIYMLKSCHRIEELILLMAPEYDELQIPEDYLLQYDFDERRLLDTQDLGRELEFLTKVRFKVLHGDYQTWKDKDFTLERFFNGAQLAIEITKLLRDHAVNLTSITFETTEQDIEIFFEEEREDQEEEDSATNRPTIKVHLDYDYEC